MSFLGLAHDCMHYDLDLDIKVDSDDNWILKIIDPKLKAIVAEGTAATLSDVLINKLELDTAIYLKLHCLKL